MQVECPSCGCRFKVNGGAGRPKVDLITQNILSELRDTLSVKATAKNFNCGVDTIKRRLKYIGIDTKTITGRKYTKQKGENNENRNKRS